MTTNGTEYDQHVHTVSSMLQSVGQATGKASGLQSPASTILKSSHLGYYKQQ